MGTEEGGSSRVSAAFLLVVLVTCLSPSAAADCLDSVWADPWAAGLTYDTVFPNWSKAPVAAFGLYEWDDAWSAWCPNSSITGITILNYGTASGGAAGDITAVYFQLQCGTSTQSGFRTLTFAGNWLVGAATCPAWTWTGPLAFGDDTCVAPTAGCSCFPNLYLYADIASCPTPGAVVDLGPAYLPPWLGAGITDDCGCGAPWEETRSEAPKTISYIMAKGDLTEASPGDTVTYTVYAGRAGTAAYSNLVVLDSVPAYTHYVAGSASPAPDPGWDPDPGPPSRLRWTFPAGSPAGGATVEMTFQVTVDWGNGESFEPGSGDQAAPELGRLMNGAAVSLIGGGCPGVAASSPPTRTVVKRFLFWKLGSNDLLFAGKPGLPDDEMVYEIFIKNISATKTWWNVRIWDTVPAQFDSWGSGLGFEDPCVGWTMTPTGCAVADPGAVTTGAGTTIMTWTLDLPPQQTMSLRWKAVVKPTTPAGQTAINRVSIRELGAPGISGGTGDSMVPAVFTHLAKIALRTTYYSYNSYAASGDQRGCPGFFITFFPLNINTNFEFRKLEYTAAGVAVTGGKSATINTFVGTCVGGFADGGHSMAGCKAERVPAMYWPAQMDDICPAYPFDYFYKVTSNCPFLWIGMSEGAAVQMDAHTWVPSTSLSYRGFVHYTTVRPCEEALTTAGRGDRLAILNTAIDAYDVFDPSRITTVHCFQWNPATMGWDYLKSGDIEAESFWMPFEGTLGVGLEDVFHLRIISSDAQNLIYQGFHTWGAPSIGGAFDNYGTICPNRENGNLIASGVPANYYLVCHPGSRTPNVVIGNVGAAAATYNIWLYVPDSAQVPSANWPVTLAGAAGHWTFKGQHTVTAGLATGANPLNPHTYGNGEDLAMTTAASTAQAWKVELTAGGPIEILHGGCIYDSWSGASNMHASDGSPSGDDFWWFQGPGGGGFGVGCSNPETYVINVFAPKTGMAVGMNSTGGWSATYTTDGPDQVVVWQPLTRSNKHSYHITLRPAGVQGLCIAQYFQCTFDEKFLTAPFIETGVHYELIVPSVAYTGVPFWITVIVVDNGGGTKTDYCGTSSFTSTDPLARIESTAMDGFNFTWSNQWTCNVAPNENGVKVFVNVSLTRLGSQTIVASDTTDGSIMGLGTVMVVGVGVKLEKEPRFSTAASGDTVRFKICWSNYSSGSAFSFVLNDAVPQGMNYVPEASSSALDCGATWGMNATISYSTLQTGTIPQAASFTTGNPVAGTRWLRWSIPVAGVFTTGCACYRVQLQ